MGVQRFSLILSILAGLVSATGFAPLGLWPLTLLGLVVLVHLVWTAPTLRAATARGYGFGLGQFVLGLNWIAGSFAYQSAMPAWLGWIAVVLLSCYLAIYPALATGLAYRLGRNGGGAVFALCFAASWIVTEWLRATLFTGFAWNPLSVAFVEAAQASRWFGTYGVSGLVILFAAGLWMLARCRWSPGLALACLPLGLTGAALLNLPDERPATATRLHVVQPNIGQQDKHVAGFDAVNFGKLAQMSGRPGPTPRLVLWPEAAIPDYLEEEPAARLRVAALLGPRDMLLTGGVALEFAADGQVAGARNSVFALGPDGRLLARYDKAHLVPYGEYLPMRPILSAIGLSRLVPGDLDFWPGPGPQTRAVPGFGQIGFQVCYEMIFSGAVVDPAARPDVIFNPSNDAWFGSWGPPQHLAQAQMRALEEGLPIIRSTPTGISAVINARGRVISSLPYRQAGAIMTHLPAADAPTLFARFGNRLALGLAFLLVIGAIATRRALR